MHRHELEPGDVAARTTLRHQAGPPLRAVPESATAVFFGASYHADYATILAAPADLAAVCEAVVESLAAEDHSRWDVVDLRRLRAGDPATDALANAFEWAAPRAGWVVTREQEDVCPVVTLAPGQDFEGYLGTLDKKERHEIRRKVRRAEAAGTVALEQSADPIADLDAFIDLHQKRWGDDGLFPPTEGGAASRRFFAGLFEDCAPSGIVDLSFLSVGGRRIAAGVTFDDGEAVYYYNAGVDPDARDLSPGVVMVACYVQRAIELGRTRLDFMRGNEPYKYEWGAVDEPIERLLVQRTARNARPRPRPAAAAPARATSHGRRTQPWGALRGHCGHAASAARGRVRVVEVMATGTNGGAQEHVYSLVTRLDPANYDVRVVSLSHGSSVRRLEKAGIEVSVIDEPDDRTAVRALAERAARLDGTRGHPQPHVSGRGRRDSRRPAARRDGLQAAGHHLDRPFEPHPLRRRSRGPSPADAADGPPDRRFQGHRAEDPGGRPHRARRSA